MASCAPPPETNETFWVPPLLKARTVAVPKSMLDCPVSLAGLWPSAAFSVALSNFNEAMIVSGQSRAPRLMRLTRSGSVRYASRSSKCAATFTFVSGSEKARMVKGPVALVLSFSSPFGKASCTPEAVYAPNPVAPWLITT